MDYFSNIINGLPEFQKANVILELGAGSFGRTIQFAKLYPDKLFYTTDYIYSALALKAMPEVLALENVRVLRVNAQDILFRDNYFDFVFSVALMEHIPKLKECLSEVYRVLSKNGHYYFAQAPFWSCTKGHHYKHWVKEVMDQIPLYSHIYFTKDQMRKYLEDTKATLNIDEVIFRIYDRIDLSRMTRNETKDIVAQSPLKIKSWKDNPDSLYDEEKAQEAVEKSLYEVAFEEMWIVGADVVLIKQ